MFGKEEVKPEKVAEVLVQVRASPKAEDDFFPAWTIGQMQQFLDQCRAAGIADKTKIQIGSQDFRNELTAERDYDS